VCVYFIYIMLWHVFLFLGFVLFLIVLLTPAELLLHYNLLWFLLSPGIYVNLSCSCFIAPHPITFLCSATCKEVKDC